MTRDKNRSAAGISLTFMPSLSAAPSRFRVKTRSRCAGFLIALDLCTSVVVAQHPTRLRAAQPEDRAAWAARWIAASPQARGTARPVEVKANAGPLPIFRREFTLAEPLQRATLLYLRTGRAIRGPYQWAQCHRDCAESGVERLSKMGFLQHLRCHAVHQARAECHRSDAWQWNDR